jgi:uncharacterized protein YkwD
MAVRRIWVAAAAVPALAAALALSAPLPAGLSAEPAVAGECTNADDSPPDLTADQARDAIVCLINQRRTERGRRRLDHKSSLGKAAGRHTRHMKRRGCFSHECPGEKDLAGRIHDTSYLPCGCSWGVGENIAWGTGDRGSPRNIVQAWMDSPSHRANMLNRDFRHIGVGVGSGTPSRSSADGAIYTTDFGYKKG